MSETPSPLAGEGWGGGEGAIYDSVGGFTHPRCQTSKGHPKLVPF